MIFLLNVIFLPYKTASSPNLKPTIVVDAGHGGMDGGSVGISGSTERVLNLEYAKTLKTYLENYGFNVVMTRTTLDGLYSPDSDNIKKDDMLARKKIIEKSNADLIVSIHMNYFPLESAKGAQVFYNPQSDVSHALADSIQSVFSSNLTLARPNSEVGDYYMLNCTSVPAVIVECGFISNPEEEALLLTEEYRKKVCYNILCGIVKYYAEVEDFLPDV
ncbi:MAG: N-acetylmuramoyl-L-alanine amidase [Clostridia bacterium]|nr:N-acetylmuramoyl-L-alanine amidase [Clostridia bacterium]